MNDVGVVQRSAFQTAHSDVDGHGSSLPLESLIRPQAQEIVNRVPGWSTMKFASDQGTPSDIASPSGRNIRGRADDYSTSALQKDLGMKMEKSAFKGRAWGETASGRTDAANLMADRLAEEVSGAAYHFKDKAAGAAAVAAAAAGPILSDLVSSASMKAWQQRERLSLHIVIEDYDYDHDNSEQLSTLQETQSPSETICSTETASPSETQASPWDHASPPSPSPLSAPSLGYPGDPNLPAQLQASGTESPRNGQASLCTFMARSDAAAQASLPRQAQAVAGPAAAPLQEGLVTDSPSVGSVVAARGPSSTRLSSLSPPTRVPPVAPTPWTWESRAIPTRPPPHLHRHLSPLFPSSKSYPPREPPPRSRSDHTGPLQMAGVLMLADGPSSLRRTVSVPFGRQRGSISGSGGFPLSAPPVALRQLRDAWPLRCERRLSSSSSGAATSKLTSVLRQQYCKKVLQSFESWHTSSVC